MVTRPARRSTWPPPTPGSARSRNGPTPPTGNLSDGNYYIRIGGSGNPDDGASRNWPNGAGVHPENSVVDAGFLELTRLGVKPPADPYVAHSLPAVDQSIKVDTPNGIMWRRYTFDGYSEKADGSPWDGTGIGRPWSLLSGERGEYVLRLRTPGPAARRSGSRHELVTRSPVGPDAARAPIAARGGPARRGRTRPAHRRGSRPGPRPVADRKSTRLNSSHVEI